MHELVHLQYLLGNGSHLTKWLSQGIRVHTAVPLQSIGDKWTTDIGRAITDKEWNTVLEYTRKVSRNPKFKFIQLMILHRVYLTPHRLHAMFPDIADVCPRCLATNANLIHMIWDCPKLIPYWSTIQATLNTVVSG